MDNENSAAYKSHVAVDDLSHMLDGASGGNPDIEFHETHSNPSHHSMRLRGHQPDVTDTQFTNRYSEESLGSSIVEDNQDPHVWSTLMSISQLLPPYISPSIYTNPFSPTSWSSQESSIYQGLPQVTGQNNIRDKEQESGTQNYKSQQTSTMAKQNTLEGTKAPHNFHLSEPRHFFSAHSTSLPSLDRVDNFGPSQSTRLPAAYPSYSTQKYGPVQPETENVSHTTRLLAEIATLKRDNHELRDSLRDAGQKMELLSSSKKSAENVNLDNIGDLIEEIHNAEKKRILAVQMLGSAVDKNRTETVGELKHGRKKYINKSVQATNVSDSEFSVPEVDEDELANTSRSSVNDSDEGNTKKMLQKQKYIEQLVARQREIMKAEMKKVLDERDDARQRVLKLEKRIASLELSHHTDNRESTLLAKLRVTEMERDMAVARLKFVAQDVNETKLIYTYIIILVFHVWVDDE
uniref:Uncharacterized protein n=1 Tax=Arion vulgaris TaxID=1028688 RepID=A0A0B6ZLJ6_9EUPU